MSGWVGIIAALAAVLVLAPLMGAFGRARGRRIRGGFAIMFLSLGAIFDPPRRHPIEAIEREEEASPDTGEPKHPTRRS